MTYNPERQLRQHKISMADMQKVIGAVRAHGTKDVWTSTANDLPKIPWAQKQKFKLEHGKQLDLYAFEKGTWKLVVPESRKLKYMRDAITEKESDVPMARDSGYAVLAKRTIGITRRVWATFLGKQAVVQTSRAIKPERDKGGTKLKGKGYLEMDLIEAKRKDFIERYSVDNFYYLALCDRLTGYSLFEKMSTKTAKRTAETLEPMLQEMKTVLDTAIVEIRSDKGSEFYGATQKLLKRMGIDQKFVGRASRVEMQNRIFQRNLYRLFRLRRGSLQAITKQAQVLCNNTHSKFIGMTPKDAAGTETAKLLAKFNASRGQPDSAYRNRPIQVGTRVRHLLKGRKLIRGLDYKSYRAKHWSSTVYPVTLKKKVGSAFRYMVHGRWFDIDELLISDGTDSVVEEIISKRKAAQDRKHAVWN